MKTPEDEAFDDLARKQGNWGGGYQAKRQMAADKLQEPVAWNKPDLEKLKHSDNCRYWDEDIYCTCGAIENAELQFWKNKALAQPAQEPVAQWLEDAFREGWEAYRESEFASKITEDWAFGNSFANCRMIDLQQNTPPQPAQEPDALTIAYQAGFYDGKKAAQRPWVGLTDDELADLWYKESLDWMEFARAHEAALKEKNNGT